MSSDIKQVSWNTDEINRHISVLEQKYNSLENQRRFLENLRTTVDEAWNGIAGTAYNEVMSIDIETYNSILRELEALTDDLRKMVSGCYTQCESEIRGQITALWTQIS